MARCSSVAALLRRHTWMRLDADAESNMCGLLSHFDYWYKEYDSSLFCSTVCDVGAFINRLLQRCCEGNLQAAHWFDLIKQANQARKSWQKLKIWTECRIPLFMKEQMVKDIYIYIFKLPHVKHGKKKCCGFQDLYVCTESSSSPWQQSEA